MSILAVVAAWLIGTTAPNATFGAPDMELIVAGLAAILACASIGYFVGRVLPFFLVPPLLAVGLWVAMWLISTGDQAPRLLSPTLDVVPNVFAPFMPQVGWVQMLWFLSLVITLTAASFMWRDATLIRAATLLVGIGVAVFAAASLKDLGPLPTSDSPEPFEYSCALYEELEVCMHPAYESMLATVGQAIANVTRPLAEATGWPLEARQTGSPQQSRGLRQREPYTYGFTFGEYVLGRFEQKVANDVVGYLFCPEVESDDPIRNGLAAWLAQQESKPRSFGESSIQVRHDPSEETAFVSAFNGLTDVERVHWLRENLFLLQACLDAEMPKSSA